MHGKQQMHDYTLPKIIDHKKKRITPDLTKKIILIFHIGRILLHYVWSNTYLSFNEGE